MGKVLKENEVLLFWFGGEVWLLLEISWLGSSRPDQSVDICVVFVLEPKPFFELLTKLWCPFAQVVSDSLEDAPAGAAPLGRMEALSCQNR